MRTVWVCLTTLLAIPPCPGQESTPIPIRWTKALELNSRADLDSEMAKPFDAPFRFTDAVQQKRLIRNCLELIELLPAVHGTESSADWVALHAVAVRCYALQLVKQGAPSRRSFMRAFRWDRSSFALMPPCLGMIYSKQNQDDARTAEARQQSWKDMEPGLRARVDPPDPTHRDQDRVEPTLLVEDAEQHVRLTEYARGDFNGDGTEDLLVESFGWFTHGSDVTIQLLIITRAGDNSLFRCVREVIPYGR